MDAIQLAYALNRTSRDEDDIIQKMEFVIVVKNLAFEKNIAVHWVSEDNVWHVLPACFTLQFDRDLEQWHCKKVFRSDTEERLPGNIRFALQYTVSGQDHWDNNNNANYFLATDSGVLLGPGILLKLINFNPLLPQDGTMHLVAAVDCSLRARRVFARWTTDSWSTYRQTPFVLQRHCSVPETTNSKSSLKQTETSLWAGRIKAHNAGSVVYAIGCEGKKRVVWDNNFGNNYVARHTGFKVLTLNLHCYQEPDQDQKFNEIVRAIREIDVDVVCLQEVGEEWNKGKGNWRTNAAKIIRNRLREHGRYYHLYKDWSHIGFDHYREGSAILSKYGFLKRKASYVSASTETDSIHSRKVVMVQIRAPYIGPINIFSVHLSWWEGGFWQQFEKLRQWAEDEGSDKEITTLLCGDFNIKAGSPAYMLIADGKEYGDQFLRASSPALFTKIFMGTSAKSEDYLADDQRIDFILSKMNNRLLPRSSKILFSGKEYQRVSDHHGYLVEFESDNKPLTLAK